MCHNFIRHLQITRKPIYQSAPCVSGFMLMLQAGWGHQQKCAELSFLHCFLLTSHTLSSIKLLACSSCCLFCFFSFKSNQFLTSHLSQTLPYPRVWYLAQGTSSTATWFQGILFHRNRKTQTKRERKILNLISVTHCWECGLIYFPHFSNDIAKADNKVWALCDLWEMSRI